MSRRARNGATVAAVAAVLLTTAALRRGADPRVTAAAAARLRLGERIYREGVLPSGQPLTATSANGSVVSGADAACVRCHRASGMGLVEGRRIIPPITGKYLFHTRAQTSDELDGPYTRGPDLAFAAGKRQARSAYTKVTLERALSDGIDASGAPLGPLMPRYRLDADDAQLLAGYLEQLSDRWSPGVTGDTLHVATVVAPGVAPARRDAMLGVLRAFVAVKNSGRELERRRDRAYGNAAERPRRAWQLHVWQLTGAPETWEAQLEAFARRQPVFALLSGISDDAWAPVQQFCERHAIPGWFPIVDLPPPGAGQSHTVYLSGGVALEAELLAGRLEETRATAPPRRVIAVRGDDGTGAGAVRALRRALGATVTVEERVLPARDAARLRAATADATGADVLVLWLRAADLAELAEVPLPPAAIYVSGTLARGEHAPLPPAWKTRARLLYPFELPSRRRVATARFRAWLETRGLPLVDERVQADAWLASLLLSEKVDEMLEDLYRDHLLERAEAILAMHVTTALYHRLSLGPGQRVASKGGYIARFGTGADDTLEADGDWLTP